MAFMRKTTLSLLCLSASTGLLLTACTSAKEKLGLIKEAPDEFSVIRRAPLEIPPHLAALPVPNPGARRPQEPTAEEMAAEALFGPEIPKTIEDDIGNNFATSAPTREPVSATASERAIIEAAGATETPDNIRQVVNEENEDTAYEDQAVIDKIFDRKIEASGSVLDPNEEAARLQQQLPRTRVIAPGTVSKAE